MPAVIGDGMLGGNVEGKERTCHRGILGERKYNAL
jgi:hypothetical protein